jgi:type III restriction enzyme
LDQTDIKSKIILNLKINNPDISFSENPISEYYLNGKEIEKLFKEILRKSGFIDSKNNSEFELFKNKIDAFQNLLLNTFNMRSENLTYKFKDIIPILVSNGSKFMEYIQEIKEFENSTLFENFNRDNIFENLSETDIWNPELEFNSTLIDENESKNIFSPTCLKNINELERLFLCNLENNEEVEYWFRNGNNGEKYFSIIYQQKDSTISNFYPDFIVKYKNGQIGIYDTKSTDSGVNDKAKEKAEFLYSYCHKFGYVGGLILMKSVGSDNSGIKRFYINSKEFYDFDNKSDWTEFSPEFKISEYKKFKK